MKHFDRNNYNNPQQYEQELKAKGCNGFCPVPWLSLGINNNGDYRMCVQAAANRKVRGVCKDSDDKTMRIEDTSLADARNSEIMKETRRDMIAGKRSEHCTRCNKEDDSGSQSRRWVDMNRYWNEFDVDDAIANTKEDGTIDTKEYPLLDLDIRMDNTCNLKCRMCGPTESHQWYTEWMKTTGYTGFKSYGHRVALEMDGSRAKIKGDNPYQWTERVDVADILQKDAPELKQMFISGGEPLIIQQNFELLQKYIDSGTAHNMELDYNTNFTSIPQRVLDQWKHFKQVNVGGSVDAIGPINNYIRHPSKWEQVTKNIHKLDTESSNNVNCWLTFTWQILNVLNVTDLIEWILEQNFYKFNRYSQSPCFTYHPVHNPLHYSVTSLPKSTKIKVEQHFKQWKEGWLRNWIDSKPEDYKMRNAEAPMQTVLGKDLKIITEWDHGRESLYNEICKGLDNMIAFMNSSDTTDALPEFWRITKILDASREENFEELYPVVAKDIKEYLDE